MMLTTYAAEYCQRKQIARVPVYSAKRFAAMVRDVDVDDLNQEHIDQYVASARAKMVPEWTIKGTVKDVRTLVIAAGGPAVRNPVRKPAPDPQPCDIADLDAIWPYLAPWSKQWIVLAYWTAARHSDVLKIQLRASEDWRVILWSAHKTSLIHKMPVSDWMRKWLKPVRIPYKKPNDHAQTIVLGELDQCCQIAGVPRIMPENIRDRALTEWSKINCGSIVHGCGLGDTRNHYVPPLEILEANCGRLRVPQAFGASQSSEVSILNAFRRLDPSAQDLITEMAGRLAAG